MTSTSDILAKVGAVLYLPLAVVFGDVVKWLEVTLFSEGMSGLALAIMQGSLYVVLIWRLVADARSKRAERRYYETKKRKTENDEL